MEHRSAGDGWILISFTHGRWAANVVNSENTMAIFGEKENI